MAAKYDGSKKHGTGRPKKAAEIERLLLEIAKRWGYTRLRDAMNNLGYDIGWATVQRSLAEPVPPARTEQRPLA